MATTDAFGHGGLAVAGSAEIEFEHGHAVDADLVVEWDFDGDGDFDQDVEDITEFLYEIETSTGRDWPSQLQGKAGPGRLQMQLRNDDDRFSYFNGDSPLNQSGNSLDPGRRVRVRTKVQRAAEMSGTTSSSLQTPDHADLDVTGDLTIGVDFDPANLTGSIQTLVAKWNATGNQRSAMLQVTDTRFPRLIHSPDGTLASQIITTSTVPLGSNRRQAVWVSIDVNNGASGHTVRFYTASTIEGTPTLISTVVTSGTTSIFNSTTVLRIGAHSTTSEPFTGSFYAAEWRSGLISSTDYRARPDVRELSVGTTSFTDVIGRVWTVNSGASIVDDPAPVDPITLARDRFDGGLVAITADELGNSWTHQTPYTFVAADNEAVCVSEGDESLMTLDVGVADYYVQATIAEIGDNVLAAADRQEINILRLIYRWQDSSNYSYVEVLPAEGLQIITFDVVNVITGSATSVFGPGALTAGNAVSGEEFTPGDHSSRVTVGVDVTGSTANLYVNGSLRTSTPVAALQTDETEVGLYAYWGLTNTRPAFDRIEVWDRVTADVDGVLWTGYVTDVTPVAEPGAPKIVTVTAEGPLANLARSMIHPEPWAGQHRTGTAVGDAIEKAGLLYPPGVIDSGDALAGSSSNAEIDALSFCRKFEEVEIGFLHEAPEGWLVYRGRDYRGDLTVAATFSDAEGAQFNYRAFELLNWKRELMNRFTAGISYGAPNLVTVGGGTSASSATGVNRQIGFTIPTLLDGDLLVVMITSTVDSNSEQWLVPIFWVRERDTGASVSRRTQVYTHIGAASESGNSVTFYNDTTNAGGSYILRYYHLRDWYGSHEGIHIGPWAVGTSFSGADPEPIVPPWGDTNPTAYIAQRAGTRLAGSGAVANATYPLGYLNGISLFQNGTTSDDDDCGMQLSSKLAMSAIEDPSTFTGFTNLQNSETSVIAIRGRNGSPPEPRGRLRITVDDVDSQRKHNIVATYDGTDVFPTQADAESWCELMLTRYANVRPIVRITFDATLSANYRVQAYQRRLSDKVRIVANNGAGMGIEDDFHIESISHRLWDAGNRWTVTWELSPAN